MRIHLLQHEAQAVSTNVLAWAAQNGHAVTRTDVLEADVLPDAGDFDLLVVAGGPQHIWEKDKNPWLGNEKKLLAAAAAAGKHVLGICLGAQLLAEVLGGRVFANPLTELGWCAVQLTSAGLTSPLFRGVPERFTMFQWHSDHFSLPEGVTRLATSPAAPNQAFADADGRLLGIQFHPDFDCGLIEDMVRSETEKWPEGPFVTPRETLLQETAAIEEPVWLMELLLDNMAQAMQSSNAPEPRSHQNDDCRDQSRGLDRGAEALCSRLAVEETDNQPRQKAKQVR